MAEMWGDQKSGIRFVWWVKLQSNTNMLTKALDPEGLRIYLASPVKLLTERLQALENVKILFEWDATFLKHLKTSCNVIYLQVLPKWNTLQFLEL